MAEHDRSLSRAELLKRGALGLAAAGSIDALAGTGVASASVKAPKPGGNLTVGIGQTFEDINVLTAFGYRWGQLMAYAMYDTLVKYDDQGKAVPLLAEKWSTPNPKTTIVTIRQGVKFHDGSPMRVEDVVWSLNRINSATQARVEQLPRAPGRHLGQGREDQRHDVQDHDQEADPHGRELALLVHHAGERRHPEAGHGRPAGRHRAVPVQAVRQGRPARPDQVRRATGTKPEPYLDSLTFKFMADAAAQVANFLSGNVNYLHDLSVATLPQVEGKNNSKLIPSGIFFEWWQPQMYFGPLADMNVRLALQYAFDKETDNKVAWAGRGHRDLEPVPEEPVLHRQALPGHL